MADSLIWISGASGGIGRAFVSTVPWPGAHVIGDIWSLLDRDLENGSVVDLRDLAKITAAR